MTVLAGIFGAAFLAGIIYAGKAAFAVFCQLSDNVAAVAAVQREWLEGGAAASELRFRDLEDLVDRLPKRWDEIKREVARLDSRARYAVKGAREELAERGLEDDRLEELAGELHIVDGGGSGSEEVYAVPTGVETSPESEDWRTAVRTMIG